MQIDPIKPTLKAPGARCLKLKYDAPLENTAFKFKLRRYMKAEENAIATALFPTLSLEMDDIWEPTPGAWYGQGLKLVRFSAQP